MTISIGQRLPSATIRRAAQSGAETISTNDYFAGRKIVLVGVPGAFTPTCTNNHVPGFSENYDAIKARGVDGIAVMAVNDHHVMGSWARFIGAENKLDFLADGNGEFTRALGLDTDLSGAGLGTRCKRFSMIVDDGVIKELNIEESPGKAETSGAARILEQL